MIREIQRVVDSTTVVASLGIVAMLWGIQFDGSYIALSIITFLLCILIFGRIGISSSRRLGGLRARSGKLLLAWALLIGILLFLAYATKHSEDFSRRVLLTWFLVTPPVLLFVHSLTRAVLLGFQSGDNARRVVIAGANDLSRRMVQQIAEDPQLGLSFQGYFDDRAPERLGKLPEGGLLGQLKDLHSRVRELRIDVIYIALPMVQEQRILKLLNDLRDTTASIYFLPDIFIFDLIQARVENINGIPAVAICETPIFGLNSLFKRAADLVFAAVVLTILAPLMLLVALGVKLSSPGPVLFKQRRYGLDGDNIVVYKFRTMTVCEDGETVAQAQRDDPRVTRFGSFLRRSSLDELPQFINVLQGRMSVVGPRPHAVAHNETYRKLIDGYMVRHKVKPGITGWAQVNGLRGETETLEKMKERVVYDLDYLRHWSLGLDLKIILKTISLLFRDRNAY